MKLRIFSMLVLVLVLSLLAVSTRADILGSADTYAVLAQGTVKNADASTVIIGNLGVSPAAACTGFAAPCTSGSDVITGTTNLGAAAAGAVSDSFTAYLALANTPGATDLTGGTLGVGSDATLAPGVYSFSSTAELNGVLTLAGGSNLAPLWIFQIGTGLTTDTGSSVAVTGTGAAAAGIYWEVGSQATLGVNTEFQGNILAGSAVVFDVGAQDTCGRAFA
jgi:type VI secretion system secreted protein VgrG